MKRAMIRVDGALRTGGAHLRARMILTVHDELLFEVPDTHVDETTALVREEMQSAADLKVPLTVDVGVGANWKEAKA